uniref:Uncharacterized protein n=1 Tax=Aegilops tauschii subsp. strangulata TaxID=200361 RepID=A0A453RSY6_AEGTS
MVRNSDDDSLLASLRENQNLFISTPEVIHNQLSVECLLKFPDTTLGVPCREQEYICRKYRANDYGLKYVAYTA